MCGACGSGRVRAPWEDTLGPPDPGAARRRAAALTRWLAPWRWTVGAWAGGYTLAGPHGALAPATGIDEVIDRARAARPDALRRRFRAATEDDADTGLALAEAVVRVSVATLYGGGPLVLTGPDPGARRRLRVRGGDLDVVPCDATTWSVSGASVPFGA
ncbi:hypothetical protein [Actinomycetospora sp. CA-053990]|uniref:hypothetical protein n=1 Tax=Actinomycetospora sp. CA-053990 TaxID=3239891 RepID=UPI003D908902